MPPGNAQEDAPNLDVRHLLGFHNGIANVLAGRRGIDDFTLANAARLGLAKANDVQRARVVHFTDSGADLRRSDVKAHDDW